MEYGYFPGCSLTSTAKEYDKSVRSMCDLFNIKLVEVNDWVCCGATPAHAISEEISLALPLKNLYNAELQGLQNILSPCPACHSHMLSSHRAAQQTNKSAELLKRLARADYNGTIKLRHLLDFLYCDIGLDKIKEKLAKPLDGIKAVSYYGCLTRLREIDIEDKEMPTIMDEIIRVLGAEPLRWSHTTECCGASFSLSKTDIVLRLVREILNAAKLAGASCIVVVCPLCQSNLDMRQVEIQKTTGEAFNIPIIYLSQLILMAQGKKYNEIGFGKHLVDPRQLSA